MKDFANIFFHLLQSQVIDFQWADIRQWEADDEGMSFNFEYVRTGKKPRWVKVFTSYVSIMLILSCAAWPS